MSSAGAIFSFVLSTDAQHETGAQHAGNDVFDQNQCLVGQIVHVLIQKAVNQNTPVERDADLAQALPQRRQRLEVLLDAVLKPPGLSHVERALKRGKLLENFADDAAELIGFKPCIELGFPRLGKLRERIERHRMQRPDVGVMVRRGMLAHRGEYGFPEGLLVRNGQGGNAPKKRVNAGRVGQLVACGPEPAGNFREVDAYELRFEHLFVSGMFYRLQIMQGSVSSSSSSASEKIWNSFSEGARRRAFLKASSCLRLISATRCGCSSSDRLSLWLQV